MAVPSVPFIFSLVPGGTAIPLSELDENFAFCIANTVFQAANVLGNLDVAGMSTLNGGLVVNGGAALNGAVTINGVPINPTGTTGTGLLVFNDTPTLISPILGTPISGDLSNCTNYPIDEVTGLGPNVLQFLQTPSNATLAAAVVDETGTGKLVFNTGPTFVAPILGTPQNGDLSNCTGFPAAALSGVDPVVHAAFGVPPNLPGGFVLYNGAAGNLTVDELLMNGSTSGQTVFKAAAVAGSTTILLPPTSGTVLLDTTLTAVPPGAVMFFAMATPPAGWLVCDGSTYATTTYPNLFAAIGYTYGGGGAVFAVPNATGAFIRGTGGNAAAMGTIQGEQLASHSHAVSDPGHNHSINDPGHTHGVNDPGHVHGAAAGQFVMGFAGPYGLGQGSLYNGTGGYPNTAASGTGISIQARGTGVSNNASGTGVSVQATGGNETRPINLAMLPCIKV